MTIRIDSTIIIYLHLFKVRGHESYGRHTRELSAIKTDIHLYPSKNLSYINGGRIERQMDSSTTVIIRRVYKNQVLLSFII